MGTGTERFRKPVKDTKHFNSEWERIFGKKESKDEQTPKKVD